MGGLKMTRWLYPSHWRLDLMQLPQIGRSSPHLMRRLRQVKQPVLVRFLILLEFVGGAEPLGGGGEASLAPLGDFGCAGAIAEGGEG
jgi:hypothetical protein